MRTLSLALFCMSGLTATVVGQQVPNPVAQTSGSVVTSGGRIAGRVLDRDTGRPIAGARVTIVGRSSGFTSDLDGRYRTDLLAPGVYAVRVAYIGFQPKQIDSVRVVLDEVTIADFALTAAALELAGVSVEAEAVAKPSSEAGLLAIQQSAAAVSDGISAETMSRTPDSDAADAIARVTGVSVFDDKFVVVRGLPERYSTTMLNGAELASPEPMRRVVPLDIFPASLLETIVTTKSATPDRPGDFSGGSVEIRTKEFPESFVFQASAKQGWNTLATLEQIPIAPRGGTDFLGIDDGRRTPPVLLPPVNDGGPEAERYAESLRNVWTPAPQRVLPDLGLSTNLGGLIGSGSQVGYVLSWTYSRDTEYVPDRLFTLIADVAEPPQRSIVYTESRTIVDWGGIGNVALRMGTSSKLSWRNMYTRKAEEAAISDAGYDTENARVIRDYQIVYTEQDFFQTQVSGEHRLAVPRSRLEWRATAAWARRDEPDNRQAQYILDQTSGEFSQSSVSPTKMWTRFLDDRIQAMQADWAFPVSLRGPDDAEFKLGGLYRLKLRDFDANFFRITVNNADPTSRAIARLAPELAFAPENLGGPLVFNRVSLFAQSYDADDRIYAAYAMVDVPALRWLRLVGGLRVEDWRIGVYPGGKDTPVAGTSPARRPEPGGPPARDYLWSGNLTAKLTDRMNFRLAAFRSVSRPDAREMSPDSYVPLAGGCEHQGNADLQRAAILNADARWELYPRPGEIVALSAFYKEFTSPIIEVVDVPGGGSCRIRFTNATSATNYGAEIEIRRTLDRLPGMLGYFTIGVNFTWVESAVNIPQSLGTYDPELDLQGQSRYLVNTNLIFQPPSGRISAALFVNYFADRIARYGTASATQQAPNVIERGRVSIDAKLQQRLTSHLMLSLSGENLTSAQVLYFHPGPEGRVTSGSYDTGAKVSLGVGYSH